MGLQRLSRSAVAPRLDRPAFVLLSAPDGRRLFSARLAVGCFPARRARHCQFWSIGRTVARSSAGSCLRRGRHSTYTNNVVV